MTPNWRYTDPSTCLDSIIFLQMNRDLWNGHLVEEIIVDEEKWSRAEVFKEPNSNRCRSSMKITLELVVYAVEFLWFNFCICLSCSGSTFLSCYFINSFIISTILLISSKIIYYYIYDTIIYKNTILW